MKWFSTSVSSILFILLTGSLVYILALFMLPRQPIHAQAAAADVPWRMSDVGAEYDDADDNKKVNAGAYVDRTNRTNLVSIGCMIGPIEGACTKKKKKLPMLFKGSLLGKTSDVIAMTFTNPPASTYAFVEDLGQTLGFIPKQTYAQGIGFSGLQFLLPIWKAFRNISYLILSLVMIVIGFMVMFRKKIDPKTVVTVQNALPRIVITLLLITFSYAIVGIMIDLMYVVILLAVSIFEGVKNTAGLSILPGPDWYNTYIAGNNTNATIYTQGNLINNLLNIRVSPWQFFGIQADGIEAFLGTLVISTLGGVLLIIGAFVSLGSGPLGLAATAAGGVALLGGPILYALMSLMMLFLFVRLGVLFISAYIQIILALLFSPLQILMEALPGSTSFSSWIKNLLANISVFPVAAIMFMLSNIFAEYGKTGGTIWAPPYVGFVNNSTAMSAIVSIGLLFTIPTIAGQIKEALKAKPGIDAGPGTVFGPMGSAGGQVFQLLYQGSFIASGFRHQPPKGHTDPVGRSLTGARTGIQMPGQGDGH